MKSMLFETFGITVLSSEQHLLKSRREACILHEHIWRLTWNAVVPCQPSLSGNLPNCYNCCFTFSMYFLLFNTTFIFKKSINYILIPYQLSHYCCISNWRNCMRKNYKSLMHGNTHLQYTGEIDITRHDIRIHWLMGIQVLSWPLHEDMVTNWSVNTAAVCGLGWGERANFRVFLQQL